MYTSVVAVAAALLASAGFADAVGRLTVQNKCDFPAYVWSVSNTPGDMNTLSANGGSYSEQYYTNPDGGGISVKMSDTTGEDDLTQFEYTLGSNGLYYDLSAINGNPFQGQGFSLTPSSDACKAFDCPASGDCPGIYHVWNDVATQFCDADSDMVIDLCPGNSGSSSNSGGSVVSESTPAATTTADYVAPVAQVTSAPAPSTTQDSAATTVAPFAFDVTQISSPNDGSGNGSPVVFTTFVTKVFTVMAGPSGPYFDVDKAKRDVHEHKAVHRGMHPRHRHPAA